jgi:hypothetical protein
MATGLMLTWVEPLYSGWPSTNMNYFSVSAAWAALKVKSKVL